MLLFDEAHNLVRCASQRACDSACLTRALSTHVATGERVCRRCLVRLARGASRGLHPGGVLSAHPLYPCAADRVVQANEAWESAVSEEESGGLPDAAEPKFALASSARMPGHSERPADDFRKLKVILRMLEQRIAQDSPKVRTRFLKRRSVRVAPLSPSLTRDLRRLARG